MPTYFVNTNAQPNGDHEVHREGCAWLDQVKDPEYLGEFTSCHKAVEKAKVKYPTADGCYYCSNECHKS